MRLACLEFTTRGSSSNHVGVLRRGSFSACSLFGFFLLIPLPSTPSACPTQVLSHLPSALKGTAVHPLDESQGLSRSVFCNLYFLPGFSSAISLHSPIIPCWYKQDETTGNWICPETYDPLEGLVQALPTGRET